MTQKEVEVTTYNQSSPQCPIPLRAYTENVWCICPDKWCGLNGYPALNIMCVPPL